MLQSTERQLGACLSCKLSNSLMAVSVASVTQPRHKALLGIYKSQGYHLFDFDSSAMWSSTFLDLFGSGAQGYFEGFRLARSSGKSVRSLF